MMKPFISSFFVVSLGFAEITTDMTNSLSPELQKQLMEYTGQNTLSDDDQISDLLKRRSMKKKFHMEQPDTLDQMDSTLKVEPAAGDTFNVYQKIIRGDTINPDSMLETLEIFGHDIFSNSRPSTFAPAGNISVPSNYVINSEDEIIILIWGRLNEEYKLKVERNGTINIPRLGPVHVAGLPFSEMKNNILSRISQIEGVNASVSVGTMRTIGVYVVGEVKSPGFYTLSALSNVTNALFAAGGPNKNGSLRNIQLKREKKLITKIDFYDFLLNGNDKSGFRLQAGDVIHVPIIKKMVAVTGNVRRSALYEIKGGETLDEVLSLAGGITPAAWTNSIQIDRFVDNKNQVVIDIDTVEKTIPSISIEDGDVVKIYPILNKNENAVYLTGNVVRPGKYEYKGSMRLTDLILDYTGLLPETYLDYAVIIRQDPPRYLNRILTFNLKDALDNPTSENDPPLQERDQIIIYHLDYFEPDRSVEIDGSVTTAGKYKLLENMKIRDLILQAGGLRDDASSTKGELYRRQVNEDRDLVSTVKIEFCVSCALDNNADHNIELKRLDRVYIRSKLGWEKERKIKLEGQFKYPGTYVLFEEETLGDLIERAGGFRKNAYVDAAVLTRKSVRELEQKRVREYSMQLENDLLEISSQMAYNENSQEAQALLEQQMALKKNLLDLKTFGRVVIDLTDKVKYDNFTLEDGDSLFVPRKLNTVSVIGEVYNPSTFQFDESEKVVSHFIEAAGGVKNTADVRHIYIIKANGSIITNKKEKIRRAVLEPGDAVVVPQKIKYANPHKIFVDTVDAIFKVSSLLGTVVALIIAVDRIRSD